MGPGGFVMPRWHVAPLVFRAPEGPAARWGGLLCVPCWAGLLCVPTGVPGAGGPGRCVCRWAVARPRAARAASFARRVVSKPGQAPPPPTGTAADPSGALHTSWAWCAEVWFGALSRDPARPRHRPWVPPPGPVGQLGRLSETAIAFVGAGRASTETDIAFAGAKWAFFGAIFRRRGDAGFKAPLLGASSGVVGFNVATLSRLAREKARPAALCHRESAKKFALRAHNGPKSAFSGVLGEFFRGNAAGRAVLGELFRARGPRRGLARPRRQLLRPERIGLKLRDLALHSGRVSAKIVVSTPTWRVIRPPVR